MKDNFLGVLIICGMIVIFFFMIILPKILIFDSDICNGLKKGDKMYPELLMKLEDLENNLDSKEIKFLGGSVIQSNKESVQCNVKLEMCFGNKTYYCNDGYSVNIDVDKSLYKGWKE